MYAATTLKTKTGEALAFLGDTIVRPHFREYILREEKAAFAKELAAAQADPLAVLSNAVHRAAFTPTATLGLSATCPPQNLSKIGVEQLEVARATYYTPSNMVLVGVGVDEAALMPLARELESLGAGSAPATVPAQYVGGKATVDGDSDHAYVALAFGNGGASAADASAMVVLEHLLGGDGCRSKATSRLNQNLAAPNEWVHSISAFNAAYSDAGLFGAYGAVAHEDATRFCDAVTAELEAVAAGVGAEDAARAKAKAKTTLAISCEGKASLMESTGMRMCAGLSASSVGARLAEVEAVGPADLQAAAKALLTTTPSVAVVG